MFGIETIAVLFGQHIFLLTQKCCNRGLVAVNEGTECTSFVQSENKTTTESVDLEQASVWCHCNATKSTFKMGEDKMASKFG